MADISIVIGIITQLTTGGAPPCVGDPINNKYHGVTRVQGMIINPLGVLPTELHAGNLCRFHDTKG